MIAVNVPTVTAAVPMATAVPMVTATAMAAPVVMAAPMPMTMGGAPMGIQTNAALPVKIGPMEHKDLDKLLHMRESIPGGLAAKGIQLSEWNGIIDAVDELCRQQFFYKKPTAECIFYCCPLGPLQTACCFCNPIAWIVCFMPFESAKTRAKEKMNAIVLKYGLEVEYEQDMSHPYPTVVFKSTSLVR